MLNSIISNKTNEKIKKGNFDYKKNKIIMRNVENNIANNDENGRKKVIIIFLMKIFKQKI